MSRFDWDSAVGLIAVSPDPRAVRRRLLSIADELGPELVGMGVSPRAWRCLGITVALRELNGLSGYCEMSEGPRRVVLVNRDDAPVRQRFTIAHEMAHLLMGDVDRSALGLTHDLEERYCDEYAQRLLVPIDELCALLPSLSCEIEDVLRISTRFGVSLAVALSASGDWFAERGKVFLAASSRGHPDRPDEIALRAYKARCGPYLIPNHVRLESLGLDELAKALRRSDRATISGYAPYVTLRLWRPHGNPRSGRVRGPVLWDARQLRSGVTLVRLDVDHLIAQWSARRQPPQLVAAAA